MKDLFHASDIDGTGQIDYEQFIAAMLDSYRVARRKEAVSYASQPMLYASPCFCFTLDFMIPHMLMLI